MEARTRARTPDLEAALDTAVVDRLRAGETRSLVELVAELAVPYEDLEAALERLRGEGVLAMEEVEGQKVFRLDMDAVGENGPRRRFFARHSQ